MTDELDRAVRSVLTDFFAQAPDRPGRPVLRLATPPPSSRFRQPSLVAATALTAAAGAVGLLALTGGQAKAPAAGGPTGNVTDPTEPSPTTEAVSTPDLGGPVPTIQLPDELQLRQVIPAVSLPAGNTQHLAYMVLGHRDEAGDVDGKIEVSVANGRLFTPAPGAGYEREAVTIAGVPGEIVRSHDHPQVTVGYQWGEEVVQVQSNAGSDPLRVEAMLQIANGMTVDEAHAELTGPVPTGWEVLVTAEWHPEADNASPTALVFADERNVDSITLSIEPSAPADFQYWYMGDTLREERLAGAEVYVSEDGRSSPPEVGGHRVFWRVGDVMVMLSSMGDVSLDDVLAAAASIRSLDAEELRSLEDHLASRTPVAADPSLTTITTWGPVEPMTPEQLDALREYLESIGETIPSVVDVTTSTTN